VAHDVFKEALIKHGFESARKGIKHSDFEKSSKFYSYILINTALSAQHFFYTNV
jgi:hypothetical protein